jgi:hypothetical protein
VRCAAAAADDDDNDDDDADDADDADDTMISSSTHVAPRASTTHAACIASRHSNCCTGNLYQMHFCYILTLARSCGDWPKAIDQALPKRKVQKAAGGGGGDADCDGDADGVDAAHETNEA